jgi:hypothetical protein
MAEQRELHERIVIGQWCVEQICGSRHALDEVYWDRYEDILHMHAWLTLPLHTRRAYLRLSFTVQEITAGVTDPQVRACLRRRIDAALTRVVSPREAPDDA